MNQRPSLSMRKENKSSFKSQKLAQTAIQHPQHFSSDASSFILSKFLWFTPNLHTPTANFLERTPVREHLSPRMPTSHFCIHGFFRLQSVQSWMPISAFLCTRCLSHSLDLTLSTLGRPFPPLSRACTCSADVSLSHFIFGCCLKCNEDTCSSLLLPLSLYSFFFFHPCCFVATIGLALLIHAPPSKPFSSFFMILSLSLFATNIYKKCEQRLYYSMM